MLHDVSRCVNNVGCVHDVSGVLYDVSRCVDDVSRYAV